MISLAEKIVPFIAVAVAMAVSPALADDAIEIQSLHVYPQQFVLSGSRERLQLVVTGITAEQQRIDLTRQATYDAGDLSVVSISDAGLVRAAGDGKLVIQVRYGRHQIECQVTASVAAKPVSFGHHVLPVLARSGCSGGACHGSPNGKAGFRLSLFGSDMKFDHVSLTRELFSRRVNLIEPEKSLLLTKPTTQIAHQGGKRLEVGEARYELLKEWIAQGCPADDAQANCIGIDVFPNNEGLLKKFPHQDQQLSVQASFDDGTVRDWGAAAGLNGDEEDLSDRRSGTDDQLPAHQPTAPPGFGD